MTSSSMGLFQLINEEMIECQDFVSPIKFMDIGNYLKQLKTQQKETADTM